MNNKSLIKLSNIIGLISIILLIFWNFIVITVSAFELKAFGERITDTFFLSIIGILGIMFGSVIINIMLNLTRIAEKLNQDDTKNYKKKNIKFIIIFLISFPILFGILFGFDYLSSKRKEKMLISSAESIIENNRDKWDKLLNYSFDENWINETKNILYLYSKTDKNFPFISVIVKDNIGNSEVFLDFKYKTKINKSSIKQDFIRDTTQKEREYLNKIFNSDFNELKFNEDDGDYELFYPYIKDGKKIIFYFSDYSPYGNMTK